MMKRSLRQMGSSLLRGQGGSDVSRSAVLRMLSSPHGDAGGGVSLPRRHQQQLWRAHSSSCSEAVEDDVDDSSLEVQEDGRDVVVTMSARPPLHRSNTENVVLSHHVGTQSSKRASLSLPVWDTEKHQATQLVDQLLHETGNLMMMSHHQEQQVRHHHHLIAFSGGIDSSLVAALLMHNHNQNQQQHASVKAILGVSAAVSAEQVATAENVAQHLGMDLQTVATAEGSHADYIANQGQACLACKTHLYSTLESIVQHAAATSTTSTMHHDEVASSGSNTNVNGSAADITHDKNYSLYNGTNADDLQDPTRLGLVAAHRFGVLSPLRGITKTQVRLAARHLGLPNWNYAASPCLRSRLALGVQATSEHLQRIERAERFVRRHLQQKQQQQATSRPLLDESSNVRVRLLTNNRACIEVDAPLLETLAATIATTDDTTASSSSIKGDPNGVVWNLADTDTCNDLVAYFVKELQFSSVQVRAFRSGSVATRSTITS